MAIDTFRVDDPALAFMLPLNQIDLKKNINPREGGIDQTHVQALMCDSPETYPPIHVATLNNGASWIVVDGYHRVTAANALKAPVIQAVRVHYTLNRYDQEHPEEIPTALKLATYNANVKNAKQLTLNERKEYALLLWFEDDNLSWAQLSKKAKLSDKTVKAHIEKWQNEGEDEDEEDADSSGESTSQSGQQFQESPDYTKKVVTALTEMYRYEFAIFGARDGTRSESKRAKSLVRSVKHSEFTVQIFESLARSLNQAAGMIREKIQPGE